MTRRRYPYRSNQSPPVSYSTPSVAASPAQKPLDAMTPDEGIAHLQTLLTGCEEMHKAFTSYLQSRSYRPPTGTDFMYQRFVALVLLLITLLKMLIEEAERER